ncbi:MAG: putative DNA-binding domain-containing protein [Polyangiaceae bacterium]|nr:putative DNA-binding domain-containing protein [Polyangiaceae bacterium]
MTGALAAAQRAMVERVLAPDGDDIYRTLVRGGIADTLRFQLRCTHKHAGARWRSDVERYVSEAPPHSRYLRDVGRLFFNWALPHWKADATLPAFLIDLARWELLGFDVLNAENDAAPDKKAELVLERSVRIASSVHVFYAEFDVHLLPDDEEDMTVPARGEVKLCVYRDETFSKRTLALTPSAAILIESLKAGRTLGDAVTAAAMGTSSPLDAAFLQAAAHLLEDLSAREIILGLG